MVITTNGGGLHIINDSFCFRYMEYYIRRYSEAPLESFTKQIVIEVPEKDAEPREQKYYLLGNLPEDEVLRKSLHAQRLVSWEYF